MFQNRLDRVPLKFFPLEHKILREMKRYSLVGKSLLVAVSGGQDSIVLLHILYRLQAALKISVSVVHIHHGSGARAQLAYRNRAQKFVEAEAENLGLSYFTNVKKPQRDLKSEADFRDYRYKEINKILDKIEKNTGARPLLAIGHHQDDQVETQMIRLVRGTGVQGLLGMEFYSLTEGKIRPMLLCAKNEVTELAKKLNLKWCKDPSNESVDPLRNWLRQKFFTPLEKKNPGAKTSLARSLALIAKESKVSSSFLYLIKNKALSRAQFLELSREEKPTAIAQYLRQLEIHDYTQGQIEEICRRLDNRRISYTFTILKHEWRIDARQIRALKL